jgi:hypothetical protein
MEMKGLEDKPQNGPKSKNCSYWAKWANVSFIGSRTKPPTYGPQWHSFSAARRRLSTSDPNKSQSLGLYLASYTHSTLHLDFKKYPKQHKPCITYFIMLDFHHWNIVHG